MIGVLNPFSAGREFQKLKSERKWLIAILLVFIPGLLSLAGELLIQRKSVGLTQAYIEEMGTPAAQTEALGNIQGLIMVLGIVFGIIFIVLFWVLKSVVFHAFARAIGGEKVEISSTIHLIAYTYLPFIFRGLLDLYRGLTFQPPSYEQFMSELMHPDLLLNFIKEHDIFFIWALILMVIAVKQQYNLGKGKAAIVVLVPYIVAWVLEIALTTITSQFAGGM